MLLSPQRIDLSSTSAICNFGHHWTQRVVHDATVNDMPRDRIGCVASRIFCEVLTPEFMTQGVAAVSSQPVQSQPIQLRLTDPHNIL